MFINGNGPVSNKTRLHICCQLSLSLIGRRIPLLNKPSRQKCLIRMSWSERLRMYTASNVCGSCCSFVDKYLPHCFHHGGLWRLQGIIEWGFGLYLLSCRYPWNTLFSIGGWKPMAIQETIIISVIKPSLDQLRLYVSCKKIDDVMHDWHG